MAKDEHVALLKQSVAAWNAWHVEKPPNIGLKPFTSPDLSEADLSRANLSGADLSWVHLGKANLSEANLQDANLNSAYLRGADLSGANLVRADLSGANLEEANLSQANLGGADLTLADLSGANLRYADLKRAHLFSANLRMANLIGASLYAANLHGANLNAAILRGADLQGSQLVDTDFRDADLTNCRIFGISAWLLKLEGAKQQNLVITHEGEPEITVDNIEVAQFIYLLLRNEKLREVIDTITSKSVLILGRFTADRKAVLDALREELRRRDYLPILFDFERPRSLDTDETITLLARMAKFIIADVSDAKGVLQELRAIVPDLPSVPVQPVILATQEEPGMFDFYRNRPSFLTVHRYTDQQQLLADLGDKVIRPAELKVLELRG
jgi:uncharacterized protein YjbI with pentapeptide repeats